jgi:hypothetical protein
MSRNRKEEFLTTKYSKYERGEDFWTEKLEKGYSPQNTDSSRRNLNRE